MKRIIKLFHREWTDLIIIDEDKNRFHRNNFKNEEGGYTFYNKLLKVDWDNWGEELFVTHNKDNNYYLVETINFIHEEWEDTCYLDYINNVIYRKLNFQKGNFKFENDNLVVLWDEVEENTILEQEEKDLFEQKIPNLIHFVYGFKEQTEEFNLYRYIAIKSAYEVNKPDKIYFHYYNEPYGYWWDKIKPILTLEKIDPPTEIYENKLYHYAHKADIVRLMKIIEYGGIYLDIDTICLRSFKHLLTNDFIMAAQNNSDNDNIYGLCNAVILGKPNSFFANKWLESYKTFRSKGRDEYWDEHSVLKPHELSKIYPNDIKVLDSEAFFYPLWYDINNVLFNERYDTDLYKKIIENSYVIHLWDTYSHPYLKELTEEIIFKKNTLYNIFARKFLRNQISIVFLTYNRLDVTKRCLESYLKSLDRSDIEEIIILDNNSDSEMISYLKEYQTYSNKIKIIFSNENLGVCGGRIILFNEAIGDIIISLDSDAYLMDNSFFDRVKDLLYDEKYGIVGISGAYIKSWIFGSQIDIDDHDENEYIVEHIAGCCQSFRRDLFHFNFALDPYYDKFWVEDTDLSMQSLFLNKINYRIKQKDYIEHHWGGSGKNFQDLFTKNWNYFVKKWKGKVLKNI